MTIRFYKPIATINITEKMRKVEFVLKNVFYSNVDVNLISYWAK